MMPTFASTVLRRPELSVQNRPLKMDTLESKRKKESWITRRSRSSTTVLVGTKLAPRKRWLYGVFPSDWGWDQGYAYVLKVGCGLFD